MTPTLPAVSHVHGSWSTKDFRRVLVLRWQENGTTDTQVETLTEGTVAAVLAWGEMPKEMTPQERATTLARGFQRSFKGFDDVPENVWTVLRDQVTLEITDALAADRQERGNTASVPDDDASGYVAPTPAQTARAIVADWASAHRIHYVDHNGLGSAPDTGRVSLDDLEQRIVAALAEGRTG